MSALLQKIPDEQLDELNEYLDGYYKDLSNEARYGYLKSLLVMETLAVEFTKIDGTDRLMFCTLQANVVPEHKKYYTTEQSKKNNHETIAVFDFEKSDWRSFRIDSIKSFKIVTRGTESTLRALII